MERLQLTPGTWYGWQMLPGYSGEPYRPYFSPIQVTQVTPMKTGRGILQLAFLNALYAEGVQNFDANLRILKHEPSYLIAALEAEEVEARGKSAVISHLDLEWLRRYCPELMSRTSAPRGIAPTALSDVTGYLEGFYGL